MYISVILFPNLFLNLVILERGLVYENEEA